MTRHRLWYRTQAGEYMQGLALGNGRLAGMVWGDQQCDRVSFNHEWLWLGQHRQRDNEPVADQLPLVRDALRRGDFFAATALSNLFFAGKGGSSGLPGRVDSYQPAGDLCFTHEPDARFTARALDLRRALCTVERERADTPITGQFFIQSGGGSALCRWASTKPFSGVLAFTRQADARLSAQTRVSVQDIEFNAQFARGTAFAVRCRLYTDGAAHCQGEAIHIAGATQVCVSVQIATSVQGIEREFAAWPPADPAEFERLLQAHEGAHGALYNRLQLHLPADDWHDLPTDERIERMRARHDHEDTALIELHFHFARYLLISASAGCALPANLQGKWNDLLDPPWQSDYHFDINLQMNYWAAELCNLPECVQPLLNLVERFVPHGQKSAQDLYACRGVYLPLQSDPWGRATPEAYGWAAWVGAAPWIAQHFWWRYIYGGGREFLAERGYPFFREVARFIADYVCEDEQGRLAIMPSQSPENRFAGTGSFPVSIGVNAAMDVQLFTDALGYAIHAAHTLGVDAQEAARWQQLRDRLPPFAIGADGRLLEWDAPREEVEPGHRHVSHLYGLFPSDLFNPLQRPAQYHAAIRSLDERLAQGGGHTGWSRAWVACLFARAARGEDMLEHCRQMIREFSTDTLLDLHPPRYFQIDGNFGAAAAVLQALVQVWAERVHLLRALPGAWAQGRLAGLVIPGAHTLDVQWRDHRLVSLGIRFACDATLECWDWSHTDAQGQARAHTVKGCKGEYVRVEL